MEPQNTVSMKYLKHQRHRNNNKLFLEMFQFVILFFGRLSVYNSRVLVCLAVVQSVKNVLVDTMLFYLAIISCGLL